MARPLAERFWSKVAITDDPGDCWLWKGAGTSSNPSRDYGRFWNDGRLVLAHRVAYALAYGEPRPGTETDHLCATVRCVNPNHLEAVSHQVNIVRGKSPSAHHARKPNCPKCGQPYTTSTSGKRFCRPCKRANWNAWWRENHGTGTGTGSANRSKTRCAKGHEYTPENTYWRANGARDCRTCRRDRKRLAYQRGR